MAYDFSTLSPHDFELLTQDLLQRALNVRLESFKSGRDGGIDLRFSKEQKSGVVVQCKHYARSTFATLKSVLAKTELPKIQKLAPKRYVLVTSRPLSVTEKDKLAAVLAPYCRDPGDIYGAEDLNALLREHPDVEQAHYKLWVASTAVLEAVLNNDLFARRYLEVEEIKTRLSLFVSTDAVTRAMEALESQGFCLLSGIPGIGKTTTAEMLVAMLLEQEWECVCIASNASDAMRAYNPKRRQVFYYDDFLGQTSLSEKLAKNEDHELTKLIRTCRQRPNTKRLILTTRNYLLAQAIQQHEILARANIDEGICVVELSDYTPPIRAKILVNHLWFYGVRDSWCRKLVSSGVARKIVDHPNYSPRLIEAICRGSIPLGDTHASFARGSLALLDDPADLWRPAYENQLSDAAREVLICFASLGDGCYLDALQKAYKAFSSEDPTHLLSDARFHRAMRELEGTFLRIDPSKDIRTVAYHNPSVKDFVDGVVQRTPVCSQRLLETAVYYNQVGYAARYALGKRQNAESELQVIEAFNRQLFSDNAIPERLFREVIGEQPLRPAQRILAWRESYSKSPHAALRKHLCEISFQYLNSLNYRNDRAEDVANLVRRATNDAAKLGIEATLNFSAVVTWLLSHLSSIDDHVATKWWVEDWEGNDVETILEQVRDSFIALAESKMEDLVGGKHSASTIRDDIDEIRVGAEQLGIDSDEIDYDDAEAAHEAAEEAEEREADMRKDDWKLQHYSEREADRGIDDILDSLA